MPAKSEKYSEEAKKRYEQELKQYKMILSNNLYNARCDAGVSRAEVMDALQISTQYLSDIEHYRVDPRSFHIYKLCELYNLKPDKIIPQAGLVAQAANLPYKEKAQNDTEMTIPRTIEILSRLSHAEQKTVLKLLQTYIEIKENKQNNKKEN